MELYFAYGSNMRSARLAGRVGDVRVVGPACLRGWELRFDKPGRDGTGKANVVARARAATWGVAYALRDEAWPILDGFEPGYERVREAVASESGNLLAVHVYRYPASGAHLAPSAEYLEHLLEGAREHGLPGNCLARIRSAAQGQ